MRQPRAGKPVPVHSSEAQQIVNLIPRDFDKIPEAEDEARNWILRDHYYSVDIPRNS
jgi:hypothetical protein